MKRSDKKMNAKKENYYTIYEVVKNENGEVIDLKNINDFLDLKSASQFLSIDYSNASKYLIDEWDLVMSGAFNSRYNDYEELNEPRFAPLNNIRLKKLYSHDYFIAKCSDDVDDEGDAFEWYYDF
jgi:hypothetical protein